jgi:catechol 2,3-dioxygenase-like lactoylglutathione lyase family enzyme
VQVDRIDHFVLTVRDVEATIAFYGKALGMLPVTFGGGRRALAFGQSRISLHAADAPIRPHAGQPTPGSADLCFVALSPIETIIDHLRRSGVGIEEGPVLRTGALGPITSVYFRDPDNNLIEVSTYVV